MSETPHAPQRSTLRTVLCAVAALVASGCQDLVAPLAPDVPDQPVAAANPAGSLVVLSVRGLQPYPGSGENYSRAFAVNDAGLVVGESSVGSVEHAMVWEGGFYPTDLGTLGGTYSSAKGINNSSTIVGGANTAGGELHAAMWVKVDGAWQIFDLGTLEDGWSAFAHSVADDGTVVGIGSTSTGQHGFMWRNGVMTDLGPQVGQALAVNDLGQVVGRGDQGALAHAVLWSETGGLTDLFVVGEATDINGSGEVAGHTLSPSSPSPSAFLWTPQKGRRALGTLGGSKSRAFAINRTGVIVGESDDVAGQSHAFAWSKGKMLDLGVLPGYTASGATAINGGNTVVGYSFLGGLNESRATVWTLK
jgi:probable HAF family extracellular repeat protein